MKNTVNMVKKIAAIAAATMAMSALSATVSAQTTAFFDDYTTIQFAYSAVSVNSENVTMNKGDTASVIVTVDGCKNIKAVSSDEKVAKAQWSSDGFFGDAIMLNIKGIDGGSAKIKIEDENTGAVLQTINVTVESNEVMRSSSYTATFPVYSFATGYYYMNMNDALTESMNNSSYLYFGQVTFTGTATAEYTYYNMFTGLYYPNLDMALAAAGGNRTYVKQTELSSKTYGNGFTYFNFKTNAYYKSFNDAAAAANMSASSIYNGIIDAANNADAAHRFYSSCTGRYYANYEMALAASDGFTGYVSQAEITVNNDSTTYSSEFCYYSFETGRYYKSWNAAYEASGNNSRVVFQGMVDYSRYGTINYIYHSIYDNYYYTTYEMALAASHGNADFVEIWSELAY